MKYKNSIITSKNNPTVIKVASLAEKKYRDRERLFRIDGIKLANEALAHGIIPEMILIRESSRERIEEQLQKAPETECVLLTDEVFAKLSDEKSPEGIICVIKYLDNLKKIATINDNTEKNTGWESERILLIESVRDPGNMGTVIRSALALGTDRIIISEDSVDLYNPKTLRASMGTVFGIKADIVPSMAETVGALRKLGRNVYAAALDRNAVRLDGMKLTANDCFVIGNEGHGLTAETVNACNKTVFIPIESEAESLNAAAAAVIILWEMKKAGS